MALIQRDEDLFQDSTMTFGEHLEELRRCLFMAVLGLVAGFLIGLLVGKWVVLGMQLPLERALKRYYITLSLESLEQQRAGGQIDQVTEQKELELVRDRRMVFDDYFVEVDPLLRALSQARPDLMPPEAESPKNSATLSPIGPTKLSSSDVKAANALAARLASARTSKDPALLRLWGLLEPVEQKFLEQLAAKQTLSEAERGQLIALMNRLVERTDLYDAQAFAKSPLTPEARKYATRLDSLTDEERMRLNRLVLESEFPDQLGKSYADLVRLRLFRSVDDDPRTQAQTFSTTEPFMIYLKAAILVGAVISSPWVFWWIWSFVAAGLYPHEKYYVNVFLPFSVTLFLLGAATAFFFVFDPVLDFLLAYNKWLGMGTQPRMNEWLSFVLLMPLGFGVSFQLPLVMLFLERIGIVSIKTYIEKWRISVLIICVTSALLTPSDPYSMLFMAVPLTILYVLGILVCKYMPRRRSPAIA